MVDEDGGVWAQQWQEGASFLIISGRIHFFFSFFLFLRFYLSIFGERGREGERERNISVWLSPTCPLLGTWPATQACAPTGNQTGNPLVCRPTLNPLSYTSQGIFLISVMFPVWKQRTLLSIPFSSIYQIFTSHLVSYVSGKVDIKE